MNFVFKLGSNPPGPLDVVQDHFMTSREVSEKESSLAYFPFSALVALIVFIC